MQEAFGGWFKSFGFNVLFLIGQEETIQESKKACAVYLCSSFFLLGKVPETGAGGCG